MKTRYSLILLSFFFIVQIANAQGPGNGKGKEMHKKIEAYKVAYLTKKLDLTTEEAQKFWPLYNEMTKKEDSIRRVEHRTMRFDENTIAELTDKELVVFVDKKIMFAQQKLDLKKHYHLKLKEILPIKKIALYYIAERDFKKFLLHKLGGRGHGRGPGGGGPGGEPIPPDDF